MDIIMLHLNLDILLVHFDQEPFMFSGSLRYNLDPTATMSDEAIWKALGTVHLKRYISTLPEGLEYKMTEGGTNFR